MQVEGGETLLTMKQAAERIGLSANTLARQVKNGALKATLVGHTYLVTLTELERYDEQRKVRGFAREDHPMHGKRGGGGRPKSE